MIQYSIPAGSTSQSIFIEIRDQTTGLLSEGQDAAAMGAIYYTRDGEETAGVSSVTITGGLDGAWVSGGFFEVGFGVYRLDIPNAALASGADRVVVTVAESIPGASTLYGSALIELTNTPTAFAGQALRDVRAR